MSTRPGIFGLQAGEDVNQAALAKRLNISKQAIQKLERPGANPSIKTLARIASALGHELDLSL